VISEAVIRRDVGGEPVRALLSRLAETSKQPNVTLQVLPFSVGATALYF
jgi:Domain of unknown function (DUF5753)